MSEYNNAEMQNNEIKREQGEKNRIENEIERIDSEAERKNKELDRIEKEKNRVIKEQDRIDNEKVRVENEIKRESLYDDANSRLTNVESELIEVNSQLAHILYVTPLQFGAKGDGITDDTVAIQNALNVAKRFGGVYVFLAGKAYVSDRLELFANTTIDFGGGKIIRKEGCKLQFVNGEYGVSKFSGYNGRGNIILKNGVVDGNFKETDEVGSALYEVGAFGYCENITIQNMEFIDGSNGDHVFDLTACKNVLIDRCIFNGSHGTGRQIAEAIQIDFAGAGNFPHFGVADNTPCEDIIISNCTFKRNENNPLSISQCAIGTHTSNTLGISKNIKILNNTFIETYYRFITFPHVKDLVIENNLFINTNEGYAQDIYRVNGYSVK